MDMSTSKRTKWTDEETTALLQGMKKFGQEVIQRWKTIRDDPEFKEALKHRTTVQLKDKARNLERKRKAEEEEPDTAKLPKIRFTTDVKPLYDTPFLSSTGPTSAWTQTQIIEFADGIRRLGNSKAVGTCCREILASGSFLDELKENKTVDDLVQYYEYLKTGACDDLFPICIKCLKDVDEKERKVSMVSVGRDAQKYMTSCGQCLQTSLICLMLFLSPMSGSTLETQKQHLRKWYREEVPLSVAFRQIDMDHDNIFKRRQLSDLLLDREKYVQELIQGRCVAMSKADHHGLGQPKSWIPDAWGADRKRQKQLNKERERILLDYSKNIDTKPFFDQVVGDICLERFIESDLFWGGNPRPSLEQCLQSLDDRWDKLLVRAKSSPWLRWSIRQGHDRTTMVLRHAQHLPDDYYRVHDLLQLSPECPIGEIVIGRAQLLELVELVP